MSGIGNAVDLMAQTTRGKREKFVVEPLPDAAPLVTLTPEEFDELNLEQLRAIWKPADAKLRKAIEERVKQLEADE
jgi:hypothetical protein